MTNDPELHQLDPTGRFTDRALDYVRYRPSYPAAAMEHILEGLAEPSRLVAADVGAGTGISSRLLAGLGVNVIAVEPNAEMVAAATPHARVEWRAGTAEATGLESASVDLVVSAQAFHWFRQPEAVAEFRRLLRPHGRLALLWNSRDARDPLTRGYIEAIHAVQGEHPAERRPFDPAVVSAAGLFALARETHFESAQQLDRDGLRGRATSASYVPKQGERHARLIELLDALFEQHRDERGRVTMRYVTKLFLAEAL